MQSSTAMEQPYQLSVKLFALILLYASLAHIAADIYVPSMPFIVKALHSTPGIIQLSLFSFMLGFSVFHLVYGPLSDRIGRRQPMLIGIGISLVGTAVCFSAESASVLIVARFIQGVGVAVCNSVGRSFVRDLMTGSHLAKVASHLGMVMIFITAAAPTLGGYIQYYFDWRMVFIVLFIYSLFVWAFTWKYLPETNQHLNPTATQMKVVLRTYLTLLQHKNFLGYSINVGCAYAGVIAYVTCAPFLFQTVIGLTTVQYGWLSFVIACSLFLSFLINSRLVIKLGIEKMTLLGSGCMLLGGLIMLLLGLAGFLNVIVVMIPLACYCIGAGLTFSNAFPGAVHPFPTMAGAAGALYGCFQILGAALASALMSALHFTTQVPLAAVLFILGSIALLSWKILATAKLS